MQYALYESLSKSDDFLGMMLEVSQVILISGCVLNK